MSCNKFKKLSILLFVGLFLYTHQMIFLWLLVGTLILLSSEGRRKDKPSSQNTLIGQIREEAGRFGLKLPNRPNLRALLVRLYQKYNSSLQTYPHLATEFQDVIDEMWTSLAADPDSQHWSHVIQSAINDWPVDSKKTMDAMKEKLKKVKELSQQWDEAKTEARGGSRV